ITGCGITPCSIYYRLRDYALQHPECSAIMRIID
ncbi:antirestriction protein, partial [Escherichia coli]